MKISIEAVKRHFAKIQPTNLTVKYLPLHYFPNTVYDGAVFANLNSNKILCLEFVAGNL